jgi:signal transduction histidine kinase
MEKNIKVLIIEHDPYDIELLKYELRRSFANHILQIVQTEKDFVDALQNYVPHIILSDYSLPMFSGERAFELKQKIAPNTPFILVSGTIGEENAVGLIKSGITDYALKDKLYALTPKIVRALTEADDRKRKEEAEEEVRKMNLLLEERVRQRTAELVEANTALEAFSYSVSHDLRAPLRSVMGFAQLIKQEHSPSLTGELTELFAHIESSTKRMSAIIDDLLALAKYGKENPHTGLVNMNRLFTNVWDELLFNTPHKATIEIETLPNVEADGSMLEQVIVNLISNAVKYSSKKEKPLIKVGCEEAADSYTFYVKDNGAGFDMQEYERLFGAFQRLHALSEFDGTGVGLMLVKRIIEKHQGRVWAQGEVGKGATFYFTLPKTIQPQSAGETRRGY